MLRGMEHLSRNKARTLVRRAFGWLTEGCLVGIMLGFLYHHFVLPDEMGAMAERSMSEEKATYAQRMLLRRSVEGAIIGSVLGGLTEVSLRVIDRRKKSS